MELLVWGHSGAPVIFFPTRSARFYDYEDWKIIEALRDKIESGQLQIFCVDSVDDESFYSKDAPSARIKRHLQYEKYILNEVIPLIRNLNPDQRLIAAGCSLGGYHAVNIAFKYPFIFTKVVGMSARYDLTISLPHFNNLFDGYFNEDIYFNMPNCYIPNIHDEQLLNQLRSLSIIIVIGKEDAFLENNKQLSLSLHEKGINHDFYEWDEEAHRPRYWRRMVQLYL